MGDQKRNFHKFADGRTLKMFAVITMLIDHVTCCFLEVARGSGGSSLMYLIPGGVVLDEIGRGIGRSAFPIFCFMLVEGFLHTHDRARYFLRLLLFAAISYLPFKWTFFPRSQEMHTDVIFTLSLGFLLLWGIEKMAEHLLRPAENRLAQEILALIPQRQQGAHPAQRPGGSRIQAKAQHEESRRGIPQTLLFLAGAAALTAALCVVAKRTGTDYSYGGVLAILLLYLFYNYRAVSLTGTWIWLTFYNNTEILSVPGFWMIWCYNGVRGRQNKYFFYIFYPAHLLLMYLLRLALFGQ